jgi:hypothetical protein
VKKTNLSKLSEAFKGKEKRGYLVKGVIVVTNE